MRALCAVLLLLEGTSSAYRAAMRLPVIAFYSWATIAWLTLRLVVALQQFTAGWMVLGARPAGPALARWAAAASAALLTVELGFGLTPTNIFPAHRWRVVALYWAYSAVIFLVFRRRADARTSE